LVAKLPVQTCRFKLRISVNLCENFGDPFLDTTGGCRSHLGMQGPSDPLHRPKGCTMLVDNHAMEFLCEVMSGRTHRQVYVGRSPAKGDQHGSEPSPVATARRFGTLAAH
jgi:hypothetical protein